MYSVLSYCFMDFTGYARGNSETYVSMVKMNQIYDPAMIMDRKDLLTEGDGYPRYGI